MKKEETIKVIDQKDGYKNGSEIERKNQLIADFMGFEKVETWLEDKEMLLPQHVYDRQEGNGFDYNELMFECSYDWIMSVVEKINSMDGDIANEFDLRIAFGGHTSLRVRPEFRSSRGYDILVMEETKGIKTVYNAVIEFIKWYNKQIKTS